MSWGSRGGSTENGHVRRTYHADDGARGHVLDEASEEALGGQVGVVLLKELLGGLRQKGGGKAT